MSAAALVAEVDADVAAGGEDPCCERALVGLAQLAGEDHRDLFGAADGDVVGDQRFEEAAGAAWVVEDQRAADLDLARGELPPVAGRAIGGGQRGRDARDPAIEERLDVTGGEAVADRLQPLRLGAGRKPVRQRGVAKTGVVGLALGPLVPVEPDLRRIGEVGADLDEARPEVGVADVEVVDADAALLFEELKPDGPGRVGAVAGAEDPLVLLA